MTAIQPLRNGRNARFCELGSFQPYLRGPLIYQKGDIVHPWGGGLQSVFIDLAQIYQNLSGPQITQDPSEYSGR